MAKKLPPVHPGEILREEFLKPLNLSAYAVAAALNVPRTRIERIAREEKPVTADTALRLGKFFKNQNSKRASTRRFRGIGKLSCNISKGHSCLNSTLGLQHALLSLLIRAGLRADENLT